MDRDEVVRTLLTIMQSPSMMSAPETESICEEIDDLDDDDLDVMLCAFHQAALADGWTADDAGSFWYVMGLPVPFVGLRR